MRRRGRSTRPPETTRPSFDRENRAPAGARASRFGNGRQRKLVPYAEAAQAPVRAGLVNRRRRPPVVPRHRKSSTTFRSPRSSRYIDWSPFFMAWELKGKYPGDLQRSRRRRRSARALRRRPRASRPDRHREAARRPTASTASSRRMPTATTSWSSPMSRGRPSVARFPMLRQQWEREGQTSFRASPTTSPRDDRAGRLPGRLRGDDRDRHRRTGRASSKRDHDDYNAIMAKALADRLAEAFAEMLHQRARDDWGYGRDERLSTDELIAREISRHPPRRRLSRLSRPHRKGDALDAARRRKPRPGSG